jgi:hypothetical protein
MSALSKAVLAMLGASALIWAEDFRLTVDGVGPITFHTVLTYEGKGERIYATAVNESGEAIPYVRFCVESTVPGCLFLFWNTREWQPGEHLNWNLVAQQRIPNLAHRVVIDDGQKKQQPSADPASVRIAPGQSIFIEEMESGLDGFIRAEMVKKDVPLRVVLSPDAADLIMTGGGVERDQKWTEGWLTMPRDHADGNIMVVDRASKTMLWASEAGDRSLWKGGLARGGQRKVAERLVGNLKGVVR